MNPFARTKGENARAAPVVGGNVGVVATTGREALQPMLANPIVMAESSESAERVMCVERWRVVAEMRQRWTLAFPSAIIPLPSHQSHARYHAFRRRPRDGRLTVGGAETRHRLRGVD